MINRSLMRRFTEGVVVAAAWLLLGAALMTLKVEWDKRHPPVPAAEQLSRDTRLPRPNLNRIVSREAARNGLREEWVHAVIQQESSYGYDKVGTAGEIGLMQIKCSTARQLGLKGSCDELFDPAVNIAYGARYLKKAMDRAGGFHCFGFTLYNTGISGPLGCSKYGKAVLASLR